MGANVPQGYRLVRLDLADGHRLVALFRTVFECRSAFLDKRIEFIADLLACGLLYLKLLLQAIDIIDPPTYPRERR